MTSHTPSFIQLLLEHVARCGGGVLESEAMEDALIALFSDLFTTVSALTLTLTLKADMCNKLLDRAEAGIPFN